jgi:small subunit ribosomal protein S6
MNKLYELMVLLHPDLEIDVESPITKLEGLVEAAGGRITKRDNWGKKRLAYRISRQDFAIYVYFEIELDPSKVRQLESTISITEEVLRHIIVLHEENPARPRREGQSDDRTGDQKETADESEAEAVTAKEGSK